MKVHFTNWSSRIFDGFYESMLYNSDTEYYLNEMFQDDENPEEYEIDFTPYCEDVAARAVDLLSDYCITYNHDEIVKSMQYIGLDSPQFYNYSTDKLIIEIDFNLTKLKSYINKNKTDFNEYLKDNFTSYDGFWSFVSNNYNDFMDDYNNDDKDRCIQVMLEYFILNCIYESSWSEIKKLADNESDYHQSLYEYANEMQCNYARIVETA